MPNESPSSTAKTLIVPIVVDALCVGNTGDPPQLAFAGIDFSMMSYRVGDEYVDVEPNLSEFLESAPFDEDRPADPGIHLHWALPAALSHAASGLDFPAVPNRWLIMRKTGNTVSSSKAWIIESDYLSKTLPDAGYSITVPYTNGDDPMPYRYMGRVFDADDWFKQKQDHPGELGDEYYPKLTAVGPGDPTFAASYPTCTNVFGLHDDLENISSDAVSYRVVGWFSDPKDDPLKPDTWEEFKKTCDWEIPEGPQPARSLYVGEINAIGWRTDKSYQTPEGEAKIAIGNSPAEALSALMADQLDESDAASRPLYEKVLNALQAGQLPEYDQRGGIEKIEYRLQQDSFGALQGGTLWHIAGTEKTGDGDPALESEFNLNDSIAADLNDLNLLQQQYDRAHDEIDDLRARIFYDWYRYILAEYTPARSDLLKDVRIDDVRAFIGAEVDQLNHRVTRAGELRLAPDGAADVTRRGQLADQILILRNKIETSLGGEKKFELCTGPAPRYWHPNDPCLVIAGDSGLTKPANRYHRHAPAGIPCLVLQIDHPIHRASVDFESGPVVPNDGKKDWGGKNPWLPLRMEWQLGYKPVRKLDDDDGYPHHTVSKGFDFKDGELNLTYNNEKNQPRGNETYSGSAILTSSAAWNLKQAIEDYLDAHADLAKDDQDLFDELTSLAAELHQPPLLTQALGGFNSAMIMRKHTLRMPVEDLFPATETLDTFSNTTVKNAVGDFNTLSPMPDTYYNPLRGGFMGLNRLRIIDVFGQTHPLDTAHVIRAQSLKPPEAQPTPPHASIFVPPRFTQPARLRFRFLAADNDKLEMNMHPASSPICGWLLPNNLDGSLLLYDADGGYRGYFTPGEHEEIWHSAPGRPELDVNEAFPADSTNSHLRDFARNIQNSGIPRGFLPEFLRVADHALDAIFPATHKQYKQLSVLMGRPLALVRAELDIELKGLPAADQSWDGFRNDVRAGNLDNRETRGFTNVRIPVRLGDTLNIDDGLVGYFLENAATGKPDYQLFYAPLAEPGRNGDVIRQEAMRTINLNAAPKATPVRLTMLIDPRAKVHATTGFFPVKSLEIPPDQYVKALKAMEVSFVTEPLLLDPAKVAFPLPSEGKGNWSWISRPAPHSWNAKPIGSIDDRATLSHGPLAIENGWLDLKQIPKEKHHPSSSPEHPANPNVPDHE